MKSCLNAAHIFATFLHVLNIHAAYVLHTSGVGNAAAAVALATAPFRPKLCGKASSEPYISAAVGKGSPTPFIE